MHRMNRRDVLKRVAILLGDALSAPTVAGVLSGCQLRTSYAPQTLSRHQDELVAAISELRGWIRRRFCGAGRPGVTSACRLKSLPDA